MQNKLINIILIADKLPLGGAEMVVYNLALNLNKDKFKVYVCCLEGLGELGERLGGTGIDIINLRSYKGVDLFLPLKLARILKDKNIHIIHAHNSTALRHSVIAAWLANISIVIQTRHGDEFSCQTGWRRYLGCFLSNRAIRIVSICEHLKNKIIENEKIKNTQLTVIHNGIDIKRYTNIKIDAKQKRRELELKEDDFIFINVANIRPEKGQDVLIKAFSAVAKDNQNAKLLIVGSESNRHLAGSLKELTNKLGIEKQIIFLGQREDVAELLSVSDVFVLSSLTEGLPISVLEAMAVGMPVVATDVGGIREIIENGKNGILVPPNSKDMLSMAMTCLLNDKNKTLEFAQKGRESVVNSFSLETMVLNYENLYHKLIKECAQNRKILVVGILPPPIGGMSVYVKEQLNSTLAQSYNILHFDISKKTTANRRIITGIIYQSYLILKFIITLLVKNPKIIHIHTCSYLTFWRQGIDFSIAKFLFRKTVIIQIHGGSFDKFYDSSKGLKQLILKKILSSADCVIALSYSWKQFFERTISLKHVVTVFNGIPTSDYLTHYSARWNGRINNNTNILFVGEIKPTKGILDIEKAVPLISSKINRFTFILAGRGTNSLMTTGLMQYVGEVTGAQKYNYYQNADIFVLPSYTENLPLVILEAMASGLPVVTTNVGGIPEIIKDGENGFLIQPGDYRGLAEKITYLIEHPEVRKVMGKLNRELAIKQYDFSRVVEDLNQVYQSLLN